MLWCEHCQEHYDMDHYSDEGHLVGAEFGSTGWSLAVFEAAVALNRAFHDHGEDSDIYRHAALAVIAAVESGPVEVLT